MLTTTPFLRPRDGCVPMPITLSAPSGAISATIAAIFDVPMSSPTIRFFSFTIRPPPSLGIFPCASRSRFPHRLFAKARHTRSESIAIAQIDLLDMTTGTGERADRAVVRSDETREPTCWIVAAELDCQFSLRIRCTDLPAAPGRQRQRAHGQADRRQHRRPFAIARKHSWRLPIRSGELRQIAVPIGAEDVAASVDEGRIVPARERLMFDHVDLEPPRPLAP